MSLYSVLWHLGYQPEHYQRQINAEKHSQGKLIRQKIAQSVDSYWFQALKEHQQSQRTITFIDVLAAIPPSFTQVFNLIESILNKADESLSYGPFAIFYALASNASKGGRIWQPPASFVEGCTYSRVDFEIAVGLRPGGLNDSKRVALAQLGLSAFFPKTIALIDNWLERFVISEFYCEDELMWHNNVQGNWCQHIGDYLDEIEGLQWQLRQRTTELIHHRSQEAS